MKIEHSDLSLILSQTSIPDVFFTEYLSQANGDYVKVYLYLYFISKYNNDLKINDLAKKLDLRLPVIQEALKYWEEQGLLIRKNQGFIVANIQEIEINKVYKPKVTISAEDMKAKDESKYRASAIETINNEFFQGVMSPSWYGDITLWFKKYNFDEEVMIALFRYCFNQSALHRNYITTVADAWHKNGVKTFTDLDKYSQKREKVNQIASSIKKKLRLSRNLTEYEMAYVEKWTVNYNYEMDIIEIALRKSSSKTNISFEYIDKLLTDWNERKLNSVKKVEKYLDEQKSKPVQNKDTNNSSKSKNSNFIKRAYKNLNNFYSNM